MSPARQNQESSPTPEPSPRAFAIGTGAVFQTIGLLMVLAACIAWAISAFAIKSNTQPASKWSDFLREPYLASALLTLALAATLIGGLALLAVGVGLQGERRNSGRAAMIATGFVTTAYLLVSVLYVVGLQLYVRAIFFLLLGLASVVLFMLAGHSASILKKFPPPPGLNDATAELLEEFRQKRLERLKHYDP